MTPHASFECELYVLTKEEGGRHTPFMNGYAPQFYFRTTDVTGALTWPEGIEMVLPGDTMNVSVELMQPIALEVGQRFSATCGVATTRILVWIVPRESLPPPDRTIFPAPRHCALQLAPRVPSHLTVDRKS